MKVTLSILLATVFAFACPAFGQQNGNIHSSQRIITPTPFSQTSTGAESSTFEAPRLAPIEDFEIQPAPMPTIASPLQSIEEQSAQSNRRKITHLISHQKSDKPIPRLPMKTGYVSETYNMDGPTNFYTPQSSNWVADSGWQGGYIDGEQRRANLTYFEYNACNEWANFCNFKTPPYNCPCEDNCCEQSCNSCFGRKLLGRRCHANGLFSCFFGK